MSFSFKRPETFYTPIQRVLDFDMEARPLGWLGGDYVHKEVTAIGWAWIEDGQAVDVDFAQITKDARSHRRMLSKFREQIEKADIVTGHYIRGFDLPLLNGALDEFDLPLLGNILTQDTKNDLPKLNGTSKSQENMSSQAGLSKPKVQMDVPKWREANRLTKAGLKLTEERVVGDVLQHVELRQHLLEKGMLSPPKLWVPGGSKLEGPYYP